MDLPEFRELPSVIRESVDPFVKCLLNPRILDGGQGWRVRLSKKVEIT